MIENSKSCFIGIINKIKESDASYFLVPMKWKNNLKKKIRFAPIPFQ